MGRPHGGAAGDAEMTDESKPKVEPWMREACEHGRKHLLPFAAPEYIPHTPQSLCICEQIASAFARSRPAVAAGLSLTWREAKTVAMILNETVSVQQAMAAISTGDFDAIRKKLRDFEDGILDAPPSSDPAPAPIAPPIDETCNEGLPHYCPNCGRSFTAPAPRETTGAVARSASDAALIERLREALRGFIEQGRSLGGSHPHFANYFSFSGAIWDDARAVLAEAEGRKG